MMKPVGERNAGNRHVAFDERGGETERCHRAPSHRASPRLYNRKQLASYVGLIPAHFQSGATCRDQGISKAGNGMARTVMIELAWLWLRHQPDSPLSIWFRERVGNVKGRIRRITIVAMARKLLIALWRYLETGMVPTGAVLKA